MMQLPHPSELLHRWHLSQGYQWSSGTCGAHLQPPFQEWLCFAARVLVPVWAHLAFQLLKKWDWLSEVIPIKKIKLNQFLLFCIIALLWHICMQTHKTHEMNISITYLSSSLQLVHQMQEFLDMAAFMPMQRRRNCRNSINHLSR